MLKISNIFYPGFCTKVKILHDKGKKTLQQSAGGAKTQTSISVIDSSQIPDGPDVPVWTIFGTPKYAIGWAGSDGLGGIDNIGIL